MISARSNCLMSSIRKSKDYVFSKLFVKIFIVAFCICFANLASTAENNETIKLGVQAWPSAIVTTRVVSNILNTIGYKTKTEHVSTPVILHALKTGDMNVSLGTWYPGAEYEVEPLVKDKEIAHIANNLTDALSGLAVPMYVHN